MKPSDIQVGKTYRNRGAGKTEREVLEISDSMKLPKWGYNRRPIAPGEPVVRYCQEIGGVVYEEYLSLRSFAKWAGSEVEE